MSIHRVLRDNFDKLQEQYDANIETVLELKNVFLNDILPSVVDELALDDAATEFTREWLNDTCTPIFP
jgi:hypothetical protein